MKPVVLITSTVVGVLFLYLILAACAPTSGYTRRPVPVSGGLGVGNSAETNVGPGAGVFVPAPTPKGGEEISPERQLKIQEEILRRQGEELERQKREIQDIKRQHYYNDKLKGYQTEGQ